MEDARIVGKFCVAAGVSLAVACVVLSIALWTLLPILLLLSFVLLLALVSLANLVVFAPVPLSFSRVLGGGRERERRLGRDEAADGEPGR